MRLFGFEIARVKKAMSAVWSTGGWFGILRESFAGAWQANVAVDAPRDILAFSAVFSCVSMISTDIAKLTACLMEEDASGISTEVERNSPYSPVLYKPNRYQTWFKFMQLWIVSKLLYGNAYILKERDKRGIVIALYVLDAQRVTPLVADDGSVYYRLAKDNLSGLAESTVVPAKEIIHDTMVCLWHPLVGVSPIYACAMSATMGNRIQANSTVFFQNMSRPSGQLTAPGKIDDETAARLKTTFEENFGRGKIGRLMVAGDGLEYEPMTIPAHDAQLLEQLKFTVEDVARCFHVPMYKLGGPLPVRASVESDQQTYYSDCLQGLIEAAEALLNDGLEFQASLNYSVEFDLEGLMRMDTAARYTAKGQAIKDGWMKPDEARAGEGLGPVPGGDTPYMQQQNYSLEALAKRDAKADPFAAAGAPALPAPAAANDAQAVKELTERCSSAMGARVRAMPPLLQILGVQNG